MWFDENGQAQKTNVFIIWGAPASGKTTYVMEHKEPDDLVLDFDAIRGALTLKGQHADANNLLPVILEVRETLYRLIEREEIQCKNVWVIGLLPLYMDRERLADRLGAELIHIDTDRDECIKRMKNDPARLDKSQQMQFIDRFFENLQR